MQIDSGELLVLVIVVDIGIFLQTIMLLATARGVATCPQVDWTLWPRAVRAAMELSEHKKIRAGLALAYAEQHNPVNPLKPPRADIAEFACLRGF